MKRRASKKKNTLQIRPRPSAGNKEGMRPVWQGEDGLCALCRSTLSWVSIYGPCICAACHPPSHPDLVAFYRKRGRYAGNVDQ